MIKITASVPTFNQKWWESSRNELAKLLLEDNREMWSAEEDPQTNTKWAPLSSPYAAAKSKKYPSATILRRNGFMQDRTKILPLNSRGIFLAKVGASYGRYHMTGTSRMPARPWLGIPSMSVPKMERVVAASILKGRTIHIK